MSETMDLPIVEDGEALEELEIEISDEDLGEAAPAEPEPDPPVAEEEKPKKKPRADARIAELSRRQEEAERRAEEAMGRADATARELEEERQKRAASDRAMMVHYERALTVEADQLKRKIREARDSGDTDSEIEATSQLSAIQADLNGVKAWKAPADAAVDARPDPKPEPKPEPKAAPQSTLEPRTEDWIRQNEWFQPQNPNFDEEMHEEATSFARRLERRYKASGRADDIGSDGYYDEIDRHMSEEFPDAFGEDELPAKRSPPMKRDASVAPVSRGADSPSSKTARTIRLSADQRKMAHTMAANGAIKNSDGSRMSTEQAEKYYAVFLLKQKKD